MELRHLHYFLAVAEQLNFTRAAVKLHMAQPPLSQQIRQLESELGFQLFYRSQKGVTLTEAGRVFLEESRLVLQQLEQAIKTGRRVSRGEVGRLVIGFVSSAAYNVLPQTLREFRLQFPDVSLELRELNTLQQIKYLQEGSIDIGFVRLPIEEKALNYRPIFEEFLIVALPEAHRLAKLAKIDARSLSQEPFILFPRSLAPGLYDPIISLCQRADFSPIVAQEAIQMQTIVSLVAADMGVAIVPASLANLQRSGVVYKPFIDATPTVAIALLWKEPLTPTGKQFLDLTNAGLGKL
jgi:DNA-binding transcriptional LysR family regulator